MDANIWKVTSPALGKFTGVLGRQGVCDVRLWFGGNDVEDRLLG